LRHIHQYQCHQQVYHHCGPDVSSAPDLYRSRHAGSHDVYAPDRKWRSRIMIYQSMCMGCQWLLGDYTTLDMREGLWQLSAKRN
jgi:hypothetical protein